MRKKGQFCSANFFFAARISRYFCCFCLPCFAKRSVAMISTESSKSKILAAPLDSTSPSIAAKGKSITVFLLQIAREVV